MTAASFDHLWQEQVADSHRCQQVQLQDLLPPVERDMIKTTADANAGVINKYVRIQTGGLHYIEKHVTAGLVREICGNAVKNPAVDRLKLPGQGIERGCIDIRKQQAAALAQELPRHFTAKATGRTGNEYHCII